MDVDARGSEDHCGPVMIQEHAFSQVSEANEVSDLEPAAPRDPWSGWARMTDLPGPDEAQPDPPPAAAMPDLASVVAQLAGELADERRQRATADEARREAEAQLHDADIAAARIGAEVTAARARITELERDRDEVIRRAEELLTAVRERFDQRVAEERERADELSQRVQDAWLAAAVLRRSRPLRPRSSMPTTVDAAQEEVLEALEENETDPTFAAESPQL